MTGRLVSGGVAAAIVASLLTVGSAATGTAATTTTGTTGRYIVVLKDSVTDPGAVASQQAAKYSTKVAFVYRRAIKGYSVTIPTTLVSVLRADPRVADVVADEKLSLASQPPQIVPASIRRIHADQSSTRSGDGTGSVNINVAVLDTGIDPTHPDLNVVGGVDCRDSTGTGFSDQNGHGTEVAGHIGAIDNGIGVVGVAPGSRLWAVRVFNKLGLGNISNVLCGVDWVTATRADADTTNDIAVANMSLGSKGRDDGNCGLARRDLLHRAICRSTAAGVTYVVAAGNESHDLDQLIPAAYSEVLTATAMSDTDGQPGGIGPSDSCLSYPDDTPAAFSNFATLTSDQTHTVSAPAVCTVSTYLNGLYAANSGTSFAAPVVTGVVALCIASGACVGLTPAQIIQKVVADAATYNVSNPGYGFTGDPLRPIAGKYYGYLVHAAAY